MANQTATKIDPILSWPASSVEMVKTASLVPYARNARTHSDAQVSQIMASILEWGFTVPILRDETGMVIAGHGRLLAAQRLKLDEVPVVTADGWSESKKRAYVIADNKLALNAGWDEEMLAIELSDLRADDFDLDLVGFGLDELEEMLADTETVEMPVLPTGDKAPFQQMTFTLHDTQAEQVRRAMDAAKKLGAYINSPNENSNGNALARICETFLTDHGDC